MRSVAAMSAVEQDAYPDASHSVDRARLYRRIAWRLMPFLIICYIVNAVDRTNVSMAQLRMEHDLGFSAEVYGVGVGLFYLGYVLFEVPSNLLLERIGVRKTLLRIMVAWGIMSSCTMLVKTPMQFYAVRFLLGLAEAGFYPGMLLFITLWFPSGYRARITAMFMMGSPIASTIGSPLSGAIMVGMEGVAGLYGWQWMFLLEAAPAIVLGIAAFCFLTDQPEAATWLSPTEKAAIQADFVSDRAVPSSSDHGRVGELLRDPRFYMLAFVIFGCYTLISSSFWTPLLLREAGLQSVANIGVLAAVPPLVTIVAMFLFARHSDKSRERRWHFFATLAVGAAALFLLAALPLTPSLVIGMQTVTMACTYCGGTLLTGIFATFLSSRTRAAGMALLTSIGAISSVITPIEIGRLRVATGGYSIALLLLGAVVASAALIFVLGIPKDRVGEPRGRRSS